MATNNFTNPRAQFFDANGNPLSGGRVWFYQPGTPFTKAIYTDYAGTVPADNPVLLDSDGYVDPDTGIHLGVGLYDIQVEELIAVDTWSPLWSYPNVQGAVVDPKTTGVTIGYVNTINDLRNLAPGAFSVVHVLGYYTAGDGGGRVMVWEATSVEADNVGTVIEPTGAPAIGRWVWSPQGDDHITPQLFGGFPSDGTLVIASQIDSMISWAKSNTGGFRTIEFNMAGDYHLNSSSTFDGDLNVIIQPGIEFKNSSATITTMAFECNKLTVNTKENIVAPTPTGGMMIRVNTTLPTDVYASWWGSTALGLSLLITNFGERNRIIYSEADIVFNSYTLNLSPWELVFEADGSWDIGGSTITLGSVINTTGGYPLYGSGMYDVKFESGVCNMDLFRLDAGNIVPTDFLKNFIAINTVNGTIDITMKFTDGRMWTINDGLNQTDIGNTYHLRVDWDISGGSLIKVGADNLVEIASVTAGNYKVFSNSSNNYMLKLYQDALFSWWGGLSGIINTTSNVAAFKQAYMTSVVSNDDGFAMSIDLSGGSYILDGTSINPSGTYSGVPHFRNGLFNCTGITTGTIYVVRCPHGIKLTDLRFATVNVDYEIFSVTSGEVLIDKCELYNKREIIDASTSTDPVTILNSSLDMRDSSSTAYEIVVTGGSLVIQNCRINRLHIGSTGEGFVKSTSTTATVQINNNTFTNVGIQFYGQANCSNNHITNGRILSYNPVSAKICDNTMVTDDTLDVGIYFISSIVDFTVQGLICTGNSFVDGSTGGRGSYYVVGRSTSGSGTWSAHGHKAKVFDNGGDSLYMKFGATRIQCITVLDLAFSVTNFTWSFAYPQSPIRDAFIFSYKEGVFTDISTGLNRGAGSLEPYDVIFERQADDDVLVYLDTVNGGLIKGTLNFTLEVSALDVLDLDNP